jgi:glycosyltransferase involved in cell wall biosynthesis
MKIFLSAIACNPYLGSENYFGWAAVKCLARDHDLWVVTSKRHRLDLEKAETEGLVPKNVRFIYIGKFEEWRSSRWFGRLKDWKEYINFSEALLPVARDWHQTVKFDLAHHVTIATWRVATPLWKLGIPFIFGPVGGNEKFPLRFLTMLSPTAAGFELFRMSSNVASRFSPAVRACLRHSAHVLTSNPETENLVKAVRGSSTGVSRLLPCFHADAKIKAFARYAADKQTNGPLRLFAGGLMEGRKGVSLALEALARVKAKGVKFQYRVGSHGSEVDHLRKLAVRMGVGDEIVFASPLSGEAYRTELGTTHIYLLPSLRDSAPVTLEEAMLAGCVPVVADCGGPAVVVTDECGFKIPVSNRRQMVEDLANVILTLDHRREIILQKGAAAAKRIATAFAEENYRLAINAVYQSVIQHHAN